VCKICIAPKLDRGSGYLRKGNECVSVVAVVVAFVVAGEPGAVEELGKPIVVFAVVTSCTFPSRCSDR